MRTLTQVAVCLLVVLAGCNAVPVSLDESTDTPATGAPTGTDPPSTATDVPTATDEPTPTPEPDERPDPDEDTLGWEDGYWHDDSLAVDESDGLNESELEAVVARSKARIEHVRQLEFTEDVSIDIIGRDEFRNRSATEYTEQFRRFDNAKFEAMFLVGEDEDALAVQRRNRGANVLGFYDPTNDSIVLVSDTGEPRPDGEGTLAHELTHALQDQHWNLSAVRAPTRDEHNGQNGLVEGEANFVQYRYTERCGEQWECLSGATGDGGGPTDLHYGIYFLNFFPYSDGVTFVQHHYQEGGWEAVDALYDDLPESAEQVIYPGKYGDDEPVDVTLEDTASGEWERVRPDPQREGGLRAPYAEVGQSALSSMFAFTFTSQLRGTSYDSYNESSVVSPREFIVSEGAREHPRDLLNYDLAYTDGWEGDRLHVYRGDDETAYVWRLVWENESEAAEFVEGYERLLAHWGGSPVDGDGSVWVIEEESPFADAFYVEQDGDTVTIVNAPTTDDLDDVYEGAPTPNASG